MARLITDKDCKPIERFRSARPLMEYCDAWRRAAMMPLSEVDKLELEGNRLNPAKIRLVDTYPNRLVRMRTRLNTIAGV